MKWFMSYIVSRDNGTGVKFGHSVVDSEEHPVAKINRWNAEYGAKDRATYVLLSFQQVGHEVPESNFETVMN